MPYEFFEKIIIALITAITTGAVTFIVTYYFGKKVQKNFMSMKNMNWLVD